MEASIQEKCCYTGDYDSLTLDQPGIDCVLPDYLIKEFRQLFPSLKKRQIFFGGHPVSITRNSCKEIFQLNHNRTSPYLVCEKSDGVRYLLVVARVLPADAIRAHIEEGEDTVTQCYFVSRKGHNALDASVVDVGISYDINFASSQTEPGSRRSVVQILDGELVQEQRGGRKYFKYLVFDCLVHLGRNTCPMPLYERLRCVQKFLHCNQMLGVQPCQMEVELKDFFRLSSRKFNVIEFLMKKYTREIEHQNDGLIFNHEEKEYVIGTTNPGYIKWKPEHLNTVDFMVLPNDNFEHYSGRLLDLYTAINDQELGRYTRQFYAFMVVTPEKYDEIVEITNARNEEKINRMMEMSEDFTEVDEFGGALIAECCYDTVDYIQDRSILSQIGKEETDQIRRCLVKQGDEGRDLLAIGEMKKKVYNKNWRIYKFREDKQLPNNSEVVKKIEQSIRDGITKEDLMRRSKELNEKARG